MFEHVYITGDTHHDTDIKKFIPFMDKCDTTPEKDLMIILGDWGGVWYGDERDNAALEMYNSLPWTTFATLGNHENYDALRKYPFVDFCGGRARKVGERCYLGVTGEIYDFCGKTYLNVNGADSTDKSYRIEGESWWPQERIKQGQVDCAIENLKKHDRKVDAIISHTGGSFVVSCLGFEISPSDKMLDQILDNCDYTYHFCGHYHVDMRLSSQDRIFYDDIVEVV